METPQIIPSPYMRPVLKRYATNFAATKEFALRCGHSGIDDMQIVAIAAVTTLLEFLKPVKPERMSQA